MFSIKSFMKQCLRVWHLMKKPDTKEFTTIAKVSAIGLILIGLMGFIVALLMGFIQI